SDVSEGAEVIGSPAPFEEDDAKASIDALLASAGHYNSPDDFRALMKFVGKLPNYSPFNRMLIHIQDPGAAYVATASTWEHEFGRRIAPGAQPLIVLRPRGPVMVVFDVRRTEPFAHSSCPVPMSATDPMLIRYLSPD